MRARVRELPKVTLYDPGTTTSKTPTLALDVDGASPLDVCKWMVEEHSILVADGHFYAVRLGDLTGANEKGGWVRSGLAPYTSEEEAGRFVVVLARRAFRRRRDDGHGLPQLRDHPLDVRQAGGRVRDG